MEKEALSPSVGPVGSCGSFFLKDAVRMITSLGKGNESQTGTRDNVVSPNARLSENDGAPYLPVTDEKPSFETSKLRLGLAVHVLRWHAAQNCCRFVGSADRRFRIFRSIPERHGCQTPGRSRQEGQFRRRCSPNKMLFCVRTTPLPSGSPLKHWQ